MRRATLILLVMALAGCNTSKPESTFSVSNPTYKVDKLFTDPNGVTLYRFYDKDDWRYYLVGPNGAQMLPSTTHVTETVTQTETVYVEKGGSHK